MGQDAGSLSQSVARWKLCLLHSRARWILLSLNGERQQAPLLGLMAAYGPGAQPPPSRLFHEGGRAESAGSQRCPKHAVGPSDAPKGHFQSIND